MAMLEIDDFNQDEFHQRLRQKDEEITQIKSTLIDLQARAAILREATTSQAAMVIFVKKNKGWLRSIGKELYNLSPADKKVFVEALVPGKIEIVRGEDGGQSWSVDFRIVFNPAAFERLASEGKIKGLIPNGKYPPHPAPAGPPTG